MLRNIGCVFYFAPMDGNKIEKYFTPATPRHSKRQRSSSSPGEAAEHATVMDQGKVGDLTKGELMLCLSQLLDQKLSKLATKDDLGELANKVETLTVENNILREEVCFLKRQGDTLSSKLVDLEARSRRNNLIFKGMRVPEKTTDYCSIVRKFCSDVLGSDDRLWVNRAHPLGRDRSTIIAHLPGDGDINYIMTRVKTLKDTGYVVHRDYPREIREKRSCLAKVRAEVERVTGKRRMPLVFDHLTVEGCRFTWEGNLRAGQMDGALRLRQLLDRDFSDFLSRLKHEHEHEHEPKPTATPEVPAAEAMTSIPGEGSVGLPTSAVSKD